MTNTVTIPNAQEDCNCCGCPDTCSECPTSYVILIVSGLTSPLTCLNGTSITLTNYLSGCSYGYNASKYAPDTGCATCNAMGAPVYDSIELSGALSCYSVGSTYYRWVLNIAIHAGCAGVTYLLAWSGEVTMGSDGCPESGTYTLSVTSGGDGPLVVSF